MTTRNEIKNYNIYNSYQRIRSFVTAIRRDEKSMFETVRKQIVNFDSEQGYKFFKKNWRNMLDKDNFKVPCIEKTMEYYGEERTLTNLFNFVWKQNLTYDRKRATKTQMQEKLIAKFKYGKI